MPPAGAAGQPARDRQAARVEWKDFRADWMEAGRGAKPNSAVQPEPTDVEDFFLRLRQRFMANCNEAYLNHMNYGLHAGDTVH